MNTPFNLLVSWVLICASISILPAPSAAQTNASSASSIIKLPIRVHRFVSDEEPRLNCSLSDDEIREQFSVVNDTWGQAGILWEIESIIDVVAKKPKLFAKAMDTPGGKLAPALISNMPRKHLLRNGFNVAIAEDYGRRIGGVFLSQEDGLVFYAKKGPKGVQTPAVLAHELGHALGLPHTIFEKDNNLMMGSGKGRVPTPTKPITVSQIKIARSIAKTGKPFFPPRTESPAQTPNQIFKILDTNEDGSITVAEVKKNHRLYASEFLRKASRAPSDTLTRKQYDFIVQQQHRQRQITQGKQQRNGGNSTGRGYGPAIVPQIFSRFDADKDGSLTRDEASRPGSLVNEYFDKWDSETNADGSLTREEITARLRAEPAVQGALANKRK